MAYSFQATLCFIDVHGDAGQVTDKDWDWKLTQDYGDHEEFRGVFYEIIKREDGWHLIAKIGCMWDFASGWIDHDKVKEASLGHDILHWLIARGIIDTDYNDSIDREFYEILRERGNLPKWRAKILMWGTNTCDQKRTGFDRPIIYLFKGKRIGRKR